MARQLPEERVLEGATRLSLTDISKSYGGVHAIRHADFHVLPGEVHALVGENGAGKSTLIKILAGAESADTGAITLGGEPVTIRNAADAINLGIATVYQEAQLFGQLTVAENIFLGREVTKDVRVDWDAQNRQVVQSLAAFGLGQEFVTRKVEELSAAQQQQVSIAKALALEARVLILDEPSAILTDAEIENLFSAIRRLAAKGVSIIYITHRLDELFRIADVVTVMRDGRTLGTFGIDGLDIATVADLMVGGEFIGRTAGHAVNTKGEVRLVLNELRSRHFHDVTLNVLSGEVVVLYGLIGSGVAEISAATYGQAPVTGGAMTLNGRPFLPSSPKQAQRRGLAMLPANRKKEGLFSFQPIAFNVSVGALWLFRRLGVFMDKGKESRTADEMIKALAIKTPDSVRAVDTLSGGNAQKVVLARQLVNHPDVLVLAEPTQGVDIGAKDEIHRIIDELCDGGTAVLISTSDLSEAMRIADRLIVIRNGTTFTEFGRGASQAAVLAAASGQLTEDQEKSLSEVVEA